VKDLETAKRIVIKAVSHRLGRTYDRGCYWFWSHFVPAVDRVAASRAQRDPLLAADGYFYIGDVHDINHAPRAALRAYRKAVRLNPDFGEAWREIGLQLGAIGDYRGEVRALRKAMRVGVDDPEECAQDLRYALENVEQPMEPYCHADGSTDGEPAPAWEVWELLAEQSANEALEVLKRRRSVRVRQLRAAAYGALGDTERQLQEWEAIGRGRGWVLLGYRDWFFLTKASWNSPRFWRALRAAGRRFCQIGPKQHDGLFREIPDRRSEAAYDRRRRLVVRYHIARTTGNANAARKLADQYPKWTEIQRLAKRLCR
jgi:tetratricopeptide (TPR) repeat protein